jgi:hypothetical protein
VSSCQHGADPFPKTIGTILDTLDNGSGALYEQMAQMLVAALADSAESAASACAVLPRHQSD